MSHFSVLVITSEKPNDIVLKAVLQPWHEFETDGIEDQYVVDVDVTDEVMEQWNDPQKAVRLMGGKVICRYDASLYPGKDKYGNGGEFTLPQGAKETTATHAELGKTLRQVAEDWNGATQGKDGKFYKKTNPNNRWDWWSVGGRYADRLIAKNPAEAVKGQRSWTNENEPEQPLRFDSCQISNLDLNAMKLEQVGFRQERLNGWVEKSGADIAEVDRLVRLDKTAHEKWMTLAEPRPRGAEYHLWLGDYYGAANAEALNKLKRGEWDLPDIRMFETVQNWVQAAPALSAYAVVKDGKWHERGEMGWFGMASNEASEDEWLAEFQRLFTETHADNWVTIVDCHI